MAIRYDTFVVKNATDEFIPRQLAGGEVTAWSTGDKLRRLRMFEQVVEKIATGVTEFPQDYAARFLDRMKSL